jgi:fucose permease
VGAVFFVSLFPAVEVDAPRNAPTTFAERTKVWVEPRTLLLGVMVLGAAFTEGTATNWIALSMVEERGLTASAGAAYLAVFTGSMTVGRIAGGWFVDRFGRVAALRACFGLAAVGVLVVVFLASPVAIFLGIVLWGLGASLGYPLGVSAAADNPVNAAARVSAVAAVASLAFLSGPSIIGLLGERVGLLGAFLLVVALLAVALSVSRAARRPART